MEPTEQQIAAVEVVLKKYCNPKLEYDHIPPSQVTKEIVDAVLAKP